MHGSLDLLLQAEQKILADLAGDPSPALVVLLGDYVDRGRDSCGVLEHLLRPPPAPLRRIALCGNHEQLFSDFLENPRENMHWLDFGGRQTLLSYGVDIDYFIEKGRLRVQPFKDALLGAIPQTHRQLLANLPIYARIGPYILCMPACVRVCRSKRRPMRTCCGSGNLFCPRARDWTSLSSTATRR